LALGWTLPEPLDTGGTRNLDHLDALDDWRAGQGVVVVQALCQHR